jgi:hypothetical protein
MDDNPEVTRQIQVETSMIDIYKERSTCFYNISILYYTFHYFFSYRLGFQEVFVELLFRALCGHTLCEYFQLSLRPKGFYKLSAWLTHVMGASVMKLRPFCGAPRSRSSRDRPSASSPSCGSTMSTSCWAALLRSSSSFWRRSSSFWRCSFSSPSVLIY